MNISTFIKNNENLEIMRYKKIDRPVVYFVCDKTGEIVYIGSTADLDQRARSHRSSIKLSKKDIYYFNCPKAKCLKKESRLIREIGPIYNVRSVKNGYKRTYRRSKNWKLNAQRLRKVLKEKNMTQSALAEKVGVTRQSISYSLIERTISKKVLAKIAITLRVPVGQFISKF